MILRPPTKRRSGVLAHVTSLPSPYGIGDLGHGAYSFINFLAAARQKIWQILPLGVTDAAFSDSPYMSVSAFAGNPLLISPQLLYEDGYLDKGIIREVPVFSDYLIDFSQIRIFKSKILASAISRFADDSDDSFCQFIEKSAWLHDYCLFMTLKGHFKNLPWHRWPQELRNRQPQALNDFCRRYHEKMRFYQIEQFFFAMQWQKLHSAASSAEIKIFGDIPIYVSLDSADVWANQDIFQLDKQSGEPTHVAGVPPDYFSTTGQKWGNPLYRWNENEEISRQLADWWTLRFAHIFDQVDMVRIDHFRGFESYWSVPAHHQNALRGFWQKGPGEQFFKDIFSRLGDLQIVAEDLGEITPEVLQLRDNLGFPGMRILQFAFDGNSNNPYLPCNFETPNTVVYTGTHDNDTSVGWFLDTKMDNDRRKTIKRTANRDDDDSRGIHEDMIYLALSSTATTSIIPLQDVLGFGSDCRMNTPGTSSGNWVWRCSAEFLQHEVSCWLAELTTRFSRAGDNGGEESTN